MRAAQALLAGLMLGMGERQGAALTSAGERLAIRSLVASASAIGFTGTRRGMTEAQRKALRTLLLTGSGKFHHGDAIGADAEAHDIAVALGHAVAIHPATLPDQRAFKSASDIRSPRAPLVRNKAIARETNVLIAAPGERDEQLRSGTWATIRHARRLKRPIAIIFPDGTEAIEIATAD